MDLGLDGKVAVVTGGAKGIGQSVVEGLLEEGAKVLFADLDANASQKLVDSVENPENIAFLVGDPTDESTCKKLVADTISRFGRIDILVNNAGGQFPSPAEAISEKGWMAVINNNLNGTFFTTQQMAKSFFIPQQEGVIVNIIANIFRGFPGMAHTGAARAGVDNLTKTLAQEWAEYNIRINAIAPGVIESSGLDTYPDAMKLFFDKARKANLMKRFGTTEDVANAVMFYSSPLSSYVSGTTLYVDGLDHLAGQGMAMYSMVKQMFPAEP